MFVFVSVAPMTFSVEVKAPEEIVERSFAMTLVVTRRMLDECHDIKMDHLGEFFVLNL